MDIIDEIKTLELILLTIVILYNYENPKSKAPGYLYIIGTIVVFTVAAALTENRIYFIPVVGAACLLVRALVRAIIEKKKK